MSNERSREETGALQSDTQQAGGNAGQGCSWGLVTVSQETSLLLVEETEGNWVGYTFNLHIVFTVPLIGFWYYFVFLFLSGTCVSFGAQVEADTQL